MKKKAMLILLAGLSLLWAGMRLGPVFVPKEEAVLENRKDTLYDPVRAPAFSEGKGVNINAADAALLETLPGIGPSIANRIVAYREANGPFPHPACITEVAGVGEKLYSVIKDKICIK